MAAGDDIRAANFKGFALWVKKNGAEVKPRREIALFYAGDFINMGELGKIAKEHDKYDKADPHMGRIWTYVKEMTDNPVGKKARFSSIDTALQSCPRPPPSVTDPAGGKALKFGTMKDYAYGAKAFLTSADVAKMWTILSRLYARNTEGEIMILAEYTRDYERFAKKSDLLHTEMKKLLANKKLPDSAKKQVIAYVNRYIDAYGKKAKEMMKLVARAEAEMKAKPRG